MSDVRPNDNHIPRPEDFDTVPEAEGPVYTKWTADEQSAPGRIALLRFHSGINFIREFFAPRLKRGEVIAFVVLLIVCAVLFFAVAGIATPPV